MSVTAPTDSRVHPPDQLLQPATGAGTAMATGARTGTTPMTMPRARGTGSRATARRIGPRSGRIPVAQACRDLLADAGRELAESLRAPTAAQRYAAAHLAALRAAAAVLASRARPTTGRRASAWDLLTRVARSSPSGRHFSRPARPSDRPYRPASRASSRSVKPTTWCGRARSSWAWSGPR